MNYIPDWNSLDKRPIPNWFREAKFGIFIIGADTFASVFL
jgi:hypothetical protein